MLNVFEISTKEWTGNHLENAETVTSPKTLPAKPKTDNWPQASPDVFQGLLGEIVLTIEPHTEADSIALLIQLMTAFGSVIGRGPHFKAEADEHHLNLFSLLVGDTAKGKKGSSLGHIRGLFENVDEDWKRNCNHSGLSSGEGLIWAVRDQITKTEPLKSNGVVTDYQEVITDPGVEDKRALII